MDEDIAKEISTLSPLINTNGPLLCRQKSILENKCTETLSWTMALLHMILKIISYAKHIQ
jgi:hypothetical protein